MNLFRILFTLERSRLRSRRGRPWLDALSIFGFAIATVTLLGVSAAIHLFNGRMINPPPGVLAWFTSPSEATLFMENYAIAALLALSIMLFPTLALVASAASMITKARADSLRQLRLIGMSRRRAATIIMIEVGIQSLIGMALGSILYFSSFPMWEMLSFQGQRVSAAEIVLPMGVWLSVYQVIIMVMVPSAILSLTNLSLTRKLSAERGPEKFLTWRGLLFAMLLLGFITGLVYVVEGPASAFEALVVITAIGIVFFIIGPLFIIALGYIERLSKNPVLLLAGSRHITSPRDTWTAVAPVSILMIFTITLSVDSSMVARVIPPPITEAVFRRDLLTGINITIIVALVVGAVATALSQRASILDRQREAEALVVMGFPMPIIHRARLMETVIPLLLMMAVGLVLGVVLSWANLSAITRPGYMLRGIVLVFGVAVITSVALNRILQPLQTSVIREDARPGGL
ncbi:MAG: hypothetical protein Q4P05_09015 [Actinomycetaceae bacterium]|nr:hypothetical protein [Actinomycetaceae bacterium]